MVILKKTNKKSYISKSKIYSSECAFCMKEFVFKNISFAINTVGVARYSQSLTKWPTIVKRKKWGKERIKYETVGQYYLKKIREFLREKESEWEEQFMYYNSFFLSFFKIFLSFF